jgi:hypothetical protein
VCNPSVVGVSGCGYTCVDRPDDQHRPSGGGGGVSAGCTVLSCQLISCVYSDTTQVEMVVLCLLVALY